MKNRSIKIMGIIGIIGFMLLAGGTMLVGSMMSNDEFRDSIQEEVAQDEDDQQVSEFVNSMEDINYTLDSGLLVVFSLIGIVALILLKKKPMISALIFLVGAIGSVAVFWWMLLPIVPALLYLIAAIITFLKNQSDAHKKS
ncbi:DUF4064 domain-containing protein [Lacicoccus qingdaonensis]|uniref:DUF4064 domain-containing protein n=1 Tax=Lacicoccus qingdaonensis TaxID=576118 RepID=A0A1G9G3E9_9BACL|nr:DUF4064 domain-containing protein [Salinicoccus qingdaonensis]SDK94783.1 Protein of unknown function [Salinicoccus qingdaonensis]